MPLVSKILEGWVKNSDITLLDTSFFNPVDTLLKHKKDKYSFMQIKNINTFNEDLEKLIEYLVSCEGKNTPLQTSDCAITEFQYVINSLQERLDDSQKNYHGKHFKVKLKNKRNKRNKRNINFNSKRDKKIVELFYNKIKKVRDILARNVYMPKQPDVSEFFTNYAEIIKKKIKEIYPGKSKMFDDLHTDEGLIGLGFYNSISEKKKTAIITRDTGFALLAKIIFFKLANMDHKFKDYFTEQLTSHRLVIHTLYPKDVDNLSLTRNIQFNSSDLDNLERYLKEDSVKKIINSTDLPDPQFISNN